MDLVARISDLCKRADEITAEHWQKMNFTFSPPPIHRAEFSENWCKIITQEERNGQWKDSYIYAFVALKDNFTKNLGQIMAGDIHKPASYKAPAKHRRGSVFSSDFNNCLTPHGIVYMK